MNLDKFFDEKTVIDLSFFNFSNAVTAAYFANRNLEVLRVNKNFKKFLQRPKVEVNFSDLLKRNKTPFKLFENDFESIVIPAYPEIAIIKEKLWSCRPKFVSLSGSGSTVFGIFDDEADAKSAESLFSHRYFTFIANPVTHMLK